jgi:hypothetical protein
MTKLKPDTTNVDTNVTLETANVGTNVTLETTNPTLETANVGTNVTLETTNPTLETANVDTNVTLETTNAPANVALNPLKWLKPAMTVSANLQLQADMQATGIEAENITGFVKQLVNLHLAAAEKIDQLEARNNKMQEKYLQMTGAFEDKQDQHQDLLILNEALQSELQKKETEIAAIQQQYNSIAETNTLLLNKAAHATPAAPPKAKNFGIFSILNAE